MTTVNRPADIVQLYEKEKNNEKIEKGKKTFFFFLIDVIETMFVWINAGVITRCANRMEFSYFHGSLTQRYLKHSYYFLSSKTLSIIKGVDNFHPFPLFLIDRLTI
jgi:hypothetical protein